MPVLLRSWLSFMFSVSYALTATAGASEDLTPGHYFNTEKCGATIVKKGAKIFALDFFSGSEKSQFTPMPGGSSVTLDLEQNQALEGPDSCTTLQALSESLERPRVVEQISGDSVFLKVGCKGTELILKVDQKSHELRGFSYIKSEPLFRMFGNHSGFGKKITERFVCDHLGF